jgi:hypothetical protein
MRLSTATKKRWIHKRKEEKEKKERNETAAAPLSGCRTAFNAAGSGLPALTK